MDNDLMNSNVGIALLAFVGLLVVHSLLNFISNQIENESKIVRSLAHLLRLCSYSKCVRCENERVMFLPDSMRPCWTFIDSLKRGQSSAAKPCSRNGIGCRYYHGWEEGESCALAEILRTLSSAQRSVFVCMYSFTNDTLSNFLKYLKRSKNIQVLVLTDNQQQGRQENDQIEGLVDAGFEVRSNPGASMHNKYCIVDEAVMVSGSLNWTHAAFNTNDEMLTWTKNPRIVREVSQRFKQCYEMGSSRPV